MERCWPFERMRISLEKESIDTKESPIGMEKWLIPPTSEIVNVSI